jgi:selenide,water dikinase
VYHLGDGQALAATIDFFTPLVDDPADFGAIAAANALSDLYAMGARPVFALNVLAIPAGELPDEVVAAILRGASEVCEEAGIPVAGGHSIDDAEPKFGLVALGLVDRDRIFRKTGARPGDALVLGKALGTGVITTGIKSGEAPPEAVDAAVASMRQLNRAAMEELEEREVHAVTDVTGFGLLGHLREVCRASEVAARVRAPAPELLAGARELAEAGCVPGGTRRNRAAVETTTRWDPEVEETMRILLCDAQTSGGLLAAVPPGSAEDLALRWREAGYASAVIGEVLEEGEPRIEVEA